MNSTTLAIVQPEELDTIQRTAKLLAASGYFATSDGIMGMAQVAAKILAGRELGFGPFAAVNGIHIIQGKPTVGANLMAAAVRAHPRYDYKVKTLTDKACVLEFYDNGTLAGESSFTIEEAATAELSTGKNGATWRKFPRNMLFARAISNGVRWYAPDIFSGNAVYVPEELGATVDGDGNIIDITPRQVGPTEAEIAEAAANLPTIDDVIFERDEPPQPERLSKAQLIRLHELGEALYRKEWEERRPELVRAASKGAVESSKELTPKEADTLIRGIEKKLKEVEAQVAQQAA